MPAPPAGVKVAAGFDVLLNCVDNRLGPLNTVQAPVPTVAVFPDKIAVPVEQIVCVDPFVAVVGRPATVIVALAAEGVQGALLIVHVTT